jgi:hypothetical protein
VAIDEVPRHIYRRADSATLIGLLPELRRISLEHPADSDDAERFAADLAAYVAMTADRDLWIRNELKRRGLLPLWPGGEEHLHDDA